MRIQGGKKNVQEWIYSLGFFEPKPGSEVKIVGVYNNKQTNKQRGLVFHCL